MFYMYMELQFLFSEHCLIMVNICTKSLENILNGLRFMEQTGFQYLLLQRGIIPSILQVKLQFLFSVHRLIMISICTKFNENILNGLRVMERT